MGRLEKWDWRSLVGLEAPQIVARLPAVLPDVERFTFVRYTPRAGLDGRVTTQRAAGSHVQLTRLRAACPELFDLVPGLWAAVVATNRLSAEALREMLSHDDVSESQREAELDAALLANEGVATLVGALLPAEVLALASRCWLKSGDLVHLPLLDFHVPVRPSSLELVREAARELGIPNALILESGKSYHVYGLETLSEQDWLQLLARALLLAPLVDARYIAHRLLARRGVLRITASETKPRQPMAVDVLWKNGSSAQSQELEDNSIDGRQ